MRLRLDCAYDGTDFSGWADPAGRCAPCRGRSRRRWPPRCGSRRCGSPWPAGPTPGCTRAARWRTSTSTRGGRRLAGRSTERAGGPRRRLTASCPPTCAYAGVGRGARGVRRPVLGGLAALRLPDRRRPGARRPAVRGHVLAWGRAARPRRDERGGRAAGRRARLRRLLQAAGGRHHVRTLLDLPGRATTTGWSSAGAGRRLLPQHGARPGRLPGRRGRGPAARRRGRPRCWPAGVRDPACASCTRTG